MIRGIYRWILFLFGLAISVDAGSVISLSSELDNNYEISNSLTKEQLIPPANVILHTYFHKKSRARACLKVVTIHLYKTDGAELYVDSFLVSCDVAPPFSMTNGLLDIGGTAFLAAIPGNEVWAVFLMANKCVQRRYMDNAWEALDEVEEMDLTPDQCKQVVVARKPLPSTGTPKTPPPVALPEFGQTHGKIIMMGDSYIDHYQSTDVPDREESGPTAKMIVSRQTHKVTRECMDLVYIDMTSSEDFLDSAQVTCDNTATFVKAKDMIVYGGLIYLRDKMGEPVWAVFLMKDDCQLRTYTDNDHKLITRQDRRLDMGQCKRVVDTQKISWLPKTFKAPMAANAKQQSSQKMSLDFNERLARVQQLIAKHHGLTSLPPIQGPIYPPGSLGPQPLGPEPPNPHLLAKQKFGSNPLIPQSTGSQPLGTQSPIPPPLPTNQLGSQPLGSSTSASKPTAFNPLTQQQTVPQKAPVPPGQAVSPSMLSAASNGPKTGSPPRPPQPPPTTAQPNSDSQGMLGGVLGGLFSKKTPPTVPNQAQQTASPTVANPSQPAPPEKKKDWFW